MGKPSRDKRGRGMRSHPEIAEALVTLEAAVEGLEEATASMLDDIDRNDAKQVRLYLDTCVVLNEVRGSLCCCEWMLGQSTDGSKKFETGLEKFREVISL